ncbi:MAG: TetR/AcrR family transcriptional regulator [Marmoricola sp.]
MGSKAHPYHHGDLRSALIEAGMEIARKRGVGALGLREIARAVDVTPNAAYRHFPDLHALILTIALEAQHRLAQAIVQEARTAQRENDPAERSIAHVRAVGLAYLRFAITEPGWFELTCLSQEAPPGDGGATVTDEDVPTPHALLLDALDDMVLARVLTPERRKDAEWACWSTMQGFAVLATRGPLQGRSRRALYRLAAKALNTTIAGLTT